MGTEWWYDWPLSNNSDNKGMWVLKVTEDSSDAEVEAEIEYWMDQIKTYDPPEVHKNAIMSAVRWMTMLLSQ